MHQSYELNRTSLLLVLALAACNGDTPVDTETAGSTTESSGGTTEPDPTNPPTTDATTDPPAPTTSTSPTDPATTDPVTTDPATTDPATTDPTTDPTTETDSDTSTGADTDTDTGGELVLSGVWATVNPAGLGSDRIVGATPALDAVAPTLTIVGDVASVQSVGLRGDDAAISVDLPGGVGGVIVRDDLANDPQDGPLGLGDRFIRGPATLLEQPKGVEFMGNTDIFLVSDVGAAAILAFNVDDEGDVAPTFVISDLGSSAAIWDVAYVESTDTLYAAGTNGEVQVYENFEDDMGQGGPARTIVPAQNGNKVSINLHGVAYSDGVLYLSDVGDAMNATDGQIFRIEDVDAADGSTEVDQRIQGGDLGNPVDLEVRAQNLDAVYVAEKSNDALLVYEENLITGDLELDATFDVVKPESVAVVQGNTLIMTRNPSGLDMDAAIEVTVPLVGDPSISATLDRLGSVLSVQSLVLTADGDGLVSFDGAGVTGGGGVFLVPGLADLDADGPVDAVATRLWGAETGIVAPKGLALNAAQDRLIVADVGAVDIKVFDVGALADAAPLFTADAGVGIWDVAYHDAKDLLFAAGVDGTVYVFDDFMAAEGGPVARTITPVSGDIQGVNLHGIVYVPGVNKLIVSDVGSAMSNSDGFVYVIAIADTADDETEPELVIGGDQTALGNPVDIAVDGADLFVAEKANSLLLRYDALLSLNGVVNQAADAAAMVTNPESVQLRFTAP